MAFYLCWSLSELCLSQGVSLTQAKEKGQLVFLEGLKESLSVLIPQDTETGTRAMDFLRYTQTATFSYLYRLIFYYSITVYHCLFVNIVIIWVYWSPIPTIFQTKCASLTSRLPRYLHPPPLQGSCRRPEESLRVCPVRCDQFWRWGTRGGRWGGVGAPGVAGGRPQCAAESGGEHRRRAGLQPLLQSHRLLPATGQLLLSLCRHQSWLSVFWT